MKLGNNSSGRREHPSSSPSPAQTGVIIVAILALAACPLLSASQLEATQASTLGLQLTPPPAEFPTPFGEQPEALSPIGELKPGTYYDTDDGNLPPLSTRVGGDEFGYGDILGEDDLVLVWMTDESGTHYLIMDKNSDEFLGFQPRDSNGNPQGSRLTDDGFKYWVDQREEQVDALRSARNQYQSSAIVGIGAGVGIAVCAFTAGLGCVVGALGIAVGAAASEFVANFQGNQAEEKLQEAEFNLRGTFLDVLLDSAP